MTVIPSLLCAGAAGDAGPSTAAAGEREHGRVRGSTAAVNASYPFAGPEPPHAASERKKKADRLVPQECVRRLQLIVRDPALLRQRTVHDRVQLDLSALSDQLQGFRCSHRALAELFRQREDQELKIKQTRWDKQRLYVLELDEHQGPAEAAEAAIVYWSGKVTGEPPLFAADMSCLHLFPLCGWHGVALPAPSSSTHTPQSCPIPSSATSSNDMHEKINCHTGASSTLNLLPLKPSVILDCPNQKVTPQSMDPHIAR